VKKVLIAYFSLSGNTEKMAEYIAEGIRFTGNQAETCKINTFHTAEDLNGYDGYIFGCPTYHLDMAEPFKAFLFLCKKADLTNKTAGAFGSYTHSGDAPRQILDTMQYVFKMQPFELGAFKMLEQDLITREGLKACQDYGRVFGEKIS
jgi:flavodoxin